MNRNRLICSLSFLSAICLFAVPGHAEVWTTASSYAEAKAKAQAEGKMILGDFGQSGCSDCEGMENIFHSTSSGISQRIQAGFVYWWEDYKAADTRPWTSGLAGGYALPYVYYIDPDSPAGSAQAMSTGLLPPGNVSQTLRSLSTTLPLVVTNFPGGVLGTNALQNGQLAFGGLARTNSPMTTAIRGAAIASVMWRVRGDALPGGAFAPVTRMETINSAFVSWAADFQPVNGTNTFESYVLYANGANSWTNKVRFVYLGGAVDNPVVVKFTTASSHVTQGTNGGFALGGIGAASQTYILLAASNLTSPIVWTPVATNTTDANGAFSFSDLQATNYQRRFYRVGTP